MRIGIDLVCAEEVERSIGSHGERYLERVYTERERRDSRGRAWRLAERFAVKEATMKALGAGPEPLPWGAIGVRRTSAGGLEVELTGAAARRAAHDGAGSVSAGVTANRWRALAVVVIETDHE
jgi:holo-[acyl-carrier protein] synthase